MTPAWSAFSPPAGVGRPAVARICVTYGPPTGVVKQPIVAHCARQHAPRARHGALQLCSLTQWTVPPPATFPDAEVALSEGASVHLFAVQHCEQQPHIAEHILRVRPASVVVETALNAAHGAAAGTVLDLDDPGMLQQLQSDFFTRMFYQLGGQLGCEPEPWKSSIWQVSRALGVTYPSRLVA